MTLFSPKEAVFVTVELDSDMTYGGVADGSIRQTTSIDVVRLFHPRFPPSIAFEVVQQSKELALRLRKRMNE